MWLLYISILAGFFTATGSPAGAFQEERKIPFERLGARTETEAAVRGLLDWIFFPKPPKLVLSVVRGNSRLQ